jgi:hypothetical protein
VVSSSTNLVVGGAHHERVLIAIPFRLRLTGIVPRTVRTLTLNVTDLTYEDVSDLE